MSQLQTDDTSWWHGVTLPPIDPYAAERMHDMDRKSMDPKYKPPYEPPLKRNPPHMIKSVAYGGG